MREEVRESKKTFMTSVVILLVVLVILSVNGVKVYNKVKQEMNYTGRRRNDPHHKLPGL